MEMNAPLQMFAPGERVWVGARRIAVMETPAPMTCVTPIRVVFTRITQSHAVMGPNALLGMCVQAEAVWEVLHSSVAMGTPVPMIRVNQEVAACSATIRKAAMTGMPARSMINAVVEAAPEEGRKIATMGISAHLIAVRKESVSTFSPRYFALPHPVVRAVVEDAADRVVVTGPLPTPSWESALQK